MPTGRSLLKRHLASITTVVCSGRMPDRAMLSGTFFFAGAGLPAEQHQRVQDVPLVPV
ncbi:hypothetical protein H4K36_35870 [Streptomyces sp. DHE7-1]|nr:hypothetical protein [Streptomyces sp. DHE7-1]